LNQRFALGAGNRRPVPSPAVARREVRNEPNLPAPAAPSADRRQWTAQDRAERWLLGCLLIEPHRWHEVQLDVQVQDFTDPTRRQRADIDWTDQRDEGEPVFSELLSLLQTPELKQLAVELVDEAEQLPDVDATVRDTVAHFRKTAEQREQRKLIAALR